jgi:hypothetical protein
VNDPDQTEGRFHSPPAGVGCAGIEGIGAAGAAGIGAA